MGEKVQGLISIDWQVHNRQGNVENSIGNGAAKEPVCVTHGHERREGLLEGMEDIRWRGAKGENWDNCNSIINKIYFKKDLEGMLIKSLDEAEGILGEL